ncbi:MAG: DUF6249 domain-containing protein [Henriciella sp.]|jgi:hypothetical protein|nr:DUF6249 domain-containing protein [Henriciella sp.]
MEQLIPIALFALIFGAIWLYSHFNYKKRATAHETLRHAVDKGQQISPDLIEKMSSLSDPIKSDLRRGVLFIAFGIAFIILGSFVSTHEGEPMGPMLGIASFPIIMGLAYLGLWRFSHDRS